ncbi:putative RNA-directed DNA polymerase [Arabidopsis thaliana]
MKDLGILKYFLGIEVAHGPDGIFLSQRKYCLDIIEECGLSGARPVDTPLEQNHKLLVSTSDPFEAPDQYRRLVGRLVYLTHTRPELSYAVNILAQFMQVPLKDHWEAAQRLVRYLKSSPGQGIVLSSTASLQVNAFCDADYNSCPTTRRSLTGYMVMLGDSPVTWKTKKQSRVSLSSAEAEYRAMAMTCKELLWLKESSSSSYCG